mgnify:CR=1 FL=1
MSLWAEDTRQPLPGDWASRPTFRVRLHDGRSAILIETVPDAEAIQGHTIADFVRIASYLREQGLRAPEIYQADPGKGILLVEDFGGQSWGRILPDRQPDFYPAAADVLLRFKTMGTPTINLPAFENSYIFGRTVWFLEHYKGDTDTGRRRAFIQIWDTLMLRLQNEKRVFVHGDFHPGNLMPLDNNEVGLLDFAAGMIGPGTYDLVNLLEDIRRAVPDDIKVAMKAKYQVDEDAYAILHAQFYCRLLGQMTKRGFSIPKAVPLALQSLIHRHSVLAPLKSLVLG